MKHAGWISTYGTKSLKYGGKTMALKAVAEASSSRGMALKETDRLKGTSSRVVIPDCTNQGKRNPNYRTLGCHRSW